MLIDAHIHIVLDADGYQKARPRHKEANHAAIRNTLLTYKNRGIYILRDGGDNLDVSCLAREIAPEIGMIYRTPVYALYKQGHYGSFLGKPIADLRDFNSQFKKLLGMKPDHLKLFLTGLVDFNNLGAVDISFSFDELYYIVHKAKDHNLPVMVHANSAPAVQMAVKAGADTIEHGYYLTDQELYQMKENETIWVPTLAPLGNILNHDERYKNQKLNIRKIYESQLQNIATASQIGVKIAVGSDAGAYQVKHGQGFFDEVMHFGKAGLQTEEVYRLSFTNGRDALGVTNHELNAIAQNVK